MRKTRAIVSALALVICNTQAGVILIDYNDGVAGGGHDAVVNDGGFESFTGDQFNTDSATGNFTAGFPSALAGGWVNLLAAENQTATVASSVRTGNRAAVMSSVATTQMWGLNTGYTIASGDKFSGSFWFATAGGAEIDDSVSITLFYVADNTIDNASALNNETVTDIYTFTKGDATALTTYEESVFTSGVVDAGAIGKTLMFRIEKTAGSFVNDGANEYGRIDDIFLQSIPEPATLGMVVAFGGAALFIRRTFMM